MVLPSPPLHTSSFIHFLSVTSDKGRFSVLLFVLCLLRIIGAGGDDNSDGKMQMVPEKVYILPLIPRLVIEAGRCIRDISTQLALNGSSINGNFNEKLSLD